MCQIQDCLATVKAQGLCMNHYVQARNRGVFTVDIESRTCEITACEKLKYGKNHCEKHHKQLEKHGRLLTKKDKTLQGKFARSFSNGNKGQRWGKKESTHKARARFSYTCKKIVLERDNYTCQMCCEQPVNLHVDHIKPWASYPELRFEIDNCRTLCVPCHYFLTFKRKMPSGITWGQTLKRRTA